jgi:hypothetical protein
VKVVIGLDPREQAAAVLNYDPGVVEPAAVTIVVRFYLVESIRAPEDIDSGVGTARYLHVVDCD